MRLSTTPLVIASMVALGAVPLSASATPPNRNLNLQSGSLVTSAIPSIRTFGDKAVAVWMFISSGSGSEQRIHYATSSDSGASFTDFGALPAPAGWRWRSDPALAVDPVSGAFYAAGQLNLIGAPTHLGLGVIKGTFSGATLVWGTPVLVRDVPSATLRMTSLALAAGSPGGSVHLLFANYYSGAGVIEYQRSVDGNGATWSAPVTLSSVADQGLVSFPHLVAGPGNTLHASWLGAVGANSQPIRYRASVDLGLNWLAEETAATMRVNPALPGQLQIATTAVQPFDYSMAVNRTPGSFTFGYVGLAWSETWNDADEPFTPVASTVIRDEVEPNDTPATATPFTPGETLRGFVSSITDLDAWKMTLGAGDAVLFWPDSASTAAKIAIMDTDGTSYVANFFAATPNNVVAFRAPAAGTYYVFVPAYTQAWTGVSYRVRTRFGAPGAGEARDLRDVTVAYSNGGGWASVSHPVFGPSGYDDFMPTIAFGADGLDYVSWYDMQRSGGPGARSHLVVARNLMGFDPTPSPSVTVTNQVTDWNVVQYFIPLGIGTSNDAWGDGRRMQLAWVDGRAAEMDCYATSLSTGAFVTACASDTTVVPGTTVPLSLGVLNRNELFDEKVRVFANGARGWPFSIFSHAVLPGTGEIFAVPIAIPDTAAAGVYPIKLTVRRQSGMVLDSCAVNLTITSPVAVGNERGSEFALGAATPNPSPGACRIQLRLAEAATARITVYGLRGNLVRMLVNGPLPAGPREIAWDGRDSAGRLVPPGLYLVRARVPGHDETRRVTILR